MVVTSDKAEKRSFLGVDFVRLSHGPQSMVTKMLYKATDKVPSHSHPNEQSGYVISGQYRLYIETKAYDIGPGDSYTIPKDVPHHIEIIDPGEVVDLFTPPRKEYL